ncbi:MAG TPA: hypothetical protein VG325_09310 [Solirubrobacteraceae bacterium]|jgi:hypothetical protein|nr:hypothetical protein [Solirubrobacteraceae bacterium]
MAIANPTASRAADPAATRPTRTEKGISLARGPALILGTILLAAGLYFMYKAHSFPRSSNFPNGTAHRDGNFFFGIFGANGWTGMLTAVAGGLLLFGAAQHLLAKTMSLIVGVALGAAAVIAAVSGDVLGMAAANGWTEIGWGVCAIILLFNTLIPRRRRTIVAEEDAAVGGVAASDRRGHRATAVAPGAATTPASEPVTAREPATAREPVAERPATRETGVEPAAPAGEREPLVTREDGTPADGTAAERQTTSLRRP